MIENLALRLAVTLLLALSIAGLLYLIATARHCRTALGAHLLYIVMNAAMLVMAWWSGGGLPILGVIVFFVLAAVWSLAVMFRRKRDPAACPRPTTCQ